MLKRVNKEQICCPVVFFEEIWGGKYPAGQRASCFLFNELSEFNQTFAFRLFFAFLTNFWMFSQVWKLEKISYVAHFWKKRPFWLFA